jgi:hypothetical protein
MNDQSLDARHIAREQESRITAAATIGLNAAKALLEPDDFTLVHSLSFGNSLRIRLE